MEGQHLITITDDEQFLRQISNEVGFTDLELHSDIITLEEFCKNNEVMAMAAIQVGIPKRLIYLKNTNLDIINKMQTDSTTEEEDNYNEARVLINPVITSSEGLTEYWEACASCLDNTGKVKRPYKINVEYYDEDREKKQEVFVGFESTVLSHEMDHLDGILHMDIADEVLFLNVEERKKLRQEQGYNILAESGSFEELKKHKA